VCLDGGVEALRALGDLDRQRDHVHPPLRRSLAVGSDVRQSYYCHADAILGKRLKFAATAKIFSILRIAPQVTLKTPDSIALIHFWELLAV
jgi:hypothetical protein